MDIRKTIIIKETVTADEMGKPCPPITHVAAVVILRNPFAGIGQTDLSQLFDLSARLGASLTRELVDMLPGPPVCYDKVALFGSSDAMEHSAAVPQPKLGKPVRAAVTGGKSLMPQDHKVGALGGTIDMPLGHKEEAWSFDHIDTMTLCATDAPRADEIVLCI